VQLLRQARQTAPLAAAWPQVRLLAAQALNAHVQPQRLRQPLEAALQQHSRSSQAAQLQC